MQYEPAAMTGAAAPDPARGETRPGVWAPHAGVCEKRISAPPRTPPAILPRPASIRDDLERGHPAGKLGFDDLYRREVDVAEVGRHSGGTVICGPRAIRRAEDLV